MNRATSHLAEHRERLEYLQARLEDRAVQYLSLDPDRAKPTRLPDLLDALSPRLSGEEATAAFVDGLNDIVEAILTHFPENIFWDLDYLASALSRAGSPRQIRLMSAMVVDLQEGFGRHSILCFRYVHDFTLGFDWCRWVKEDAQDRSDTGPFDWVFLRYLQKRRRELEALIAVNDEKYHQLEKGEIRNPFAFSREPAQEQRLHELLAENGDIPVAAWSIDGECRFDKEFGKIRVALSETLKIDKASLQNQV